LCIALFVQLNVKGILHQPLLRNCDCYVTVIYLCFVGITFEPPTCVNQSEDTVLTCMYTRENNYSHELSRHSFQHFFPWDTAITFANSTDLVYDIDNYYFLYCSHDKVFVRVFEIDQFQNIYSDNEFVGRSYATCSTSISSDATMITLTTTIIVTQFGDNPWPVRGPHYWACAQVFDKLPAKSGQWFHFSQWAQVDLCAP